MAQTGFTPIQLYYSTTALATPSAANLLPGELGINITDGRLYYEDNGGVVRIIGQISSNTVITGGSITGITDLAVADGGTGASTAAGARTNLGLVIGTDVQAYDATLAALAAANWVANAIPIGSGADTVAQVTFAANTFPARSSTGNLVAKTITDFGLSLADDVDATAARTTLGLGTAATQNTGTSGATVPLLNGANTWSGVQVVEVNSASTALRVTQTGTGNALLIEDSANPDSTPFVVDAAGGVGIGVTALATGKLHVQAAGAAVSIYQNESTSGSLNGMAQRWGTGGAAWSLVPFPAGTADFSRELTFTYATLQWSIEGGVVVTGPSTFSDNSASDAVRITQTGAGNALVVEDSANPDATPFVVDASGRTLVGYTTALSSIVAAASVTPQFQSHNTNNAASSSFTRWSADAISYRLFFDKSRGATIGDYTSVAADDILGGIYFSGADGTDMANGGGIFCAVDGTPGNNDMPGRLTFHTTPDGSSTIVERMRITQAGNVLINTAAIATTATDGFFYIPSCAGIPTGAPTAFTGRVPMVYDSSNNRFYLYNGSWRYATLT